MTKRVVHSVSAPARLVALCLVLLQLVSTLHFALVPHGFGVGLSGFVHLHPARAGLAERAPRPRATEPASNRPTLVASVAACAPDACPLGFSGPPARLVPPSTLCSLIWLPLPSQRVSRAPIAEDRGRALLSAPKTSPPLTV
ncbi:MAG TPA: hypothetical protein VGJ91_04670 [Polyangiaceae bacterium]|jgi:hypothetical protein